MIVICFISVTVYLQSTKSGTWILLLVISLITPLPKPGETSYTDFLNCLIYSSLHPFIHSFIFIQLEQKFTELTEITSFPVIPDELNIKEYIPCIESA